MPFGASLCAGMRAPDGKGAVVHFRQRTPVVDSLHEEGLWTFDLTRVVLVGFNLSSCGGAFHTVFARYCCGSVRGFAKSQAL